MISTPLTTLASCTYSRADLAYRIGLLREFLEHVFFTAHDSGVTKEALESFEKTGRSVADIEFLRALPLAFFASFTQESFYEDLQTIMKDSRNLPTLSLTVPVSFDPEGREALGEWARKEIGKDVLLDLSIDAGISVGCQIVWQNQLHDFGFDHYLHESGNELTDALLKKVTASIEHV